MCEVGFFGCTGVRVRLRVCGGGGGGGRGDGEIGSERGRGKTTKKGGRGWYSPYNYTE